ncbi:hypothetical protein PHET_05741 [Paragonimus heterotremus]|uniref:T-box domain-containing protein n=1 Tax=Paragonimus heterotremus TaxID=100268 RepID=A0A8J4SKU5_9TREM|nr:hypothetical protein PHET_05741 [Paragonimus heterotremus]
MDFRRSPDYCEQTFDPRTVCSEVNMAILADELLDPHSVVAETVRDEEERTDVNYLPNTNQSLCSLHSTSFLNELSSPLLLNESSSGNETSTCSSGGQLQSNRPHTNNLIYSDLAISQKEKIHKNLNPVPEGITYLRSYISTDNLQVNKRDNVECEYVARVHENAYSAGNSKHDAKPTVATSGKCDWNGQFDRCCHPQHYHAYHHHHDSHHQHHHQHLSQQQHPMNLHFIYGQPTHDSAHSRSFQSLRQSSRKLRNHLRRGQLHGTYNSSEPSNCGDSAGGSSATSYEQNEKSRTPCDLDWQTLANVVPPVPPGGGFNWLNSRQPLFCSLRVGSGGSSEAERVSSHIQLSLREMKIWSELYTHGAEMIATNTGRRIFPPLSVNVTGLCPKDQYAFLLDMVLVQPHVFRHQGGQWSIAGQSDEEKTNTVPGTQIYVHEDSPKLGSYWMESGVSFLRAKITNNKENKNLNMLNICSMRQYIPRFTVLRIIQYQSCYSDAAAPSLGAIPDCSYTLQASSGQCSSAGTRIEYIGSYIIPGTQFYTVTAYQNPDVIRIKIDNNPFAKGFRNRQNFSELDGIIMASRIGFPNSPYGQQSNSNN